MQTIIDGTKYTIRVDHYLVQKPDHAADNPDDYFGYSEFDFAVLDADGNEVDVELTDSDVNRIESEYAATQQEEYDDWRIDTYEEPDLY